jgi:putative tricarboxylic transport membrane protein
VAGAPRFTFGRLELMSGINVVIVAMGLFGVGEILLSLEREVPFKPIGTRLQDLFLGPEDARRSVMPVLRGTAIGFFLGLIPASARWCPP